MSIVKRRHICRSPDLVGKLPIVYFVYKDQVLMGAQMKFAPAIIGGTVSLDILLTGAVDVTMLIAEIKPNVWQKRVGRHRNCSRQAYVSLRVPAFRRRVGWPTLPVLHRYATGLTRQSHAIALSEFTPPTCVVGLRLFWRPATPGSGASPASSRQRTKRCAEWEMAWPVWPGR